MNNPDRTLHHVDFIVSITSLGNVSRSVQQMDVYSQQATGKWQLTAMWRYSTPFCTRDT